MEVRIKNYNDHPITFQIEHNEKMMVNATEMAKVFGKLPKDFMALESTQEFVKEALKKENSPFLKVFSQSDLVVSVQKTGTWMHRVLALKFAAWLNPAFELWVYSTIEQLLFGNHVEREESLKNTERMKREMARLADKPDKEAGDFERYLELERRLKAEKAYRKDLTRKTVKAICGSLFCEEDFETP